MSDYLIRKLESNEFDLLLPLMKDCFGTDVSIEYFKWKFLDNPAGYFIGFVAIEPGSNEIAAYYGVIPEYYFIQNEKKKIYQSCDTMTHSRHRRKGLFQNLAIHCYDFLRENNELFVIGFSGAQSTPGFLKFGWKRPFDFANFFVPRILCYVAYLQPLPEDRCLEIKDLSLIEHLIQRKDTAVIHSFRNIEHLRWRYNNPGRNLNVVGYKHDERIDGYVTYYVQNNKTFLFDFVFETPASRKTLTNYLKRQVIKEKQKGIIAFCQEDHNTATDLKRSGFLKNPFNRGPLHEKTPFIFYTDEKTMKRFGTAASWSITSYDHDAS